MPSQGKAGNAGDRPSLIGRADEQSRLQELADRAVEQGMQMVLLSGDAGIGKSSLSRAFLATLSDAGWATHTGNCIEHSARPLPFGPIVTILRSILLDHLEHHDELIGAHRSIIASLLPELADDEATTPPDVDRLFGAITSVIARATETRPMAVLVEDIHWADAATRDLLAVLTHSLGSARVLLIATERTAAVGKGHPLHTWLSEQRRHPNVHAMRLEGFGRAELAEQAAALGAEVSDAQLDRLLDRTGGNAYFAHELLLAQRRGDDAFPASLAEFLTSRLARLGDDERRVLRAMAIAGDKVDHHTLDVMTGDLSIGPVLRSLFDAAIVVVDGQDYLFRHALLQDAILADVLPFEAEELHRKAAEAMESNPRPRSTPADLARLAFHWFGANAPSKSLSTALRAAEASVAVAAFDTAADLAVKALEVWPLVDEPEDTSGRDRDQLLLDAIDWLHSCQRNNEAVALADQALSDWVPGLPGDRRAGLLANVSTMHYLAGDPAKGTELLEEAKRLIGDASTPNAARVHYAVTRMAVSDAALTPALEAAERTIAIADEVGPESVLIDALLMKGLALGVMHSVDRGVNVVLEARRRAEASRLMNQVVVSYRVENQIRSIQQSPVRAIPVVEEGLAIAEEHCGTQLQLTLRLDLAVCLLDAGRFAEARPIIGPLLDTVIVSVRQVAVHLTAAMLALTDHDFDEVEKHLALGEAIAERFQSAQETGVQKRALAEYARHEGRLDDALSLIKEAVKLQDGNDHRGFTRETMLEKARIVHAIAVGGGAWSEERDRTLDSIATLDPFEDLPTRTVCELARFELDRIDQPFDLPRARRLTDRLIECGLAYEVARHRLVIAEHLVASGAPADEKETELRALIELASANGMHWIETQARELARRERLTIEMPADGDGAPHPSPAPDSAARELPNGLTAREVEVLALVAEGLTNKAIGERLFVSHRTVGTHVSNLLAKLHLSSRGEAIAKYHQLGLDRIDLRDPLEVD